VKKVISILTILIVCLSMLSCKSAQGGHCDAYGKAQQVELKDVG
jgi:hypothetical protein